MKKQIGIFLISAGIALGQRSPLANSDANYRALRDGTPSETFLVENIELKRDVGTITLKSGRISFLAPVMNKVTLGVFLGEGRFHLKPAIPLEALSIARMIGKGEVEEEFTSAVIYFTDATYDQIKKEGHAESSDAAAANMLKDFRNHSRQQIEQPRSLVEALIRGGEMLNVDAEVLSELYGGTGGADRSANHPAITGGALAGGGGSFRAFLHGKHFSDLRFFVAPAGAVPQISSPEEVALINVDPGNERDGIWYLTHTEAEWKAGQANSNGYKRVAVAKHYKIDTTVERNSHLSSSAEVQFEGIESGARVIRLGLLPALRVSKVTENGKEIPFIQEDKKQDGAFYVVMPEGLSAGKIYSLHIEYEGDKVIASEGAGNFSVGARQNWYPSINSFADRATYELRFKVPKQFTLVSVGKLVKESKEGDWLVSEWKADVPIPVAGFNYGLFKKKQMTDDTTHYQIETYATESAPDYLKSAAPDMAISPTAMADTARVEAQNAMRLFTSMFGPCPYGRVAITQQPAFDFGQSWPTLVYLPLSAFLDSTHRWLLMGGEEFRFASFIQEVTPHEVSHQWWGHMVGWASYHDQWLSEGFADFSAAAFIEATEKPNAVNQFWDRAQHAIADKGRYGVAPNDVGPIWMGLRLSTFKNQGAYNRLVYPKGAYILQMIRALMREDKTGDKDFFDMMKDFVETNLHRNATSEDFESMVEKHMKPILDAEGNHKFDWFFRDWVYGNALPKYRLEYSVKEASGRWAFTGKLTQSDVPADFLMRVPLYFDFDGKVVRAGYIRMQGSDKPGEATINLPKKPKRVLLNANHDLLASEIVVKEVN